MPILQPLKADGVGQNDRPPQKELQGALWGLADIWGDKMTALNQGLGLVPLLTSGCIMASQGQQGRGGGVLGFEDDLRRLKKKVILVWAHVNGASVASKSFREAVP